MRHNMWSKKMMVRAVTAAMMAASIGGNGMPVLAEEVDEAEETGILTEAGENEIDEDILPLMTNGIVDMSTDYPGITVKAGQTVSFPLDFVSQDGKGYDVILGEGELPENWKGYFKGKTNEISSVHVGGSTLETPKDGNDLATFSLDIPAEAQEGTYHIELFADAGNGEKDTLLLSVTVNELENGMSDFTTTYAEQQGASGTTFKFDTTVINNRGTGESYALAAQAPEGWQVTFTPSGESANVVALDVDAGSSKGMTVTITPPKTVEKGEYTIPCTAISADDNLSTDLTVNITGTYSAILSTSDGRLSFDAYANKPSTITLAVANTGNVDLENLNLTSNAPTGWEVVFSESTIDLLEAGAVKEITATITPDENVITGDYVNVINLKNAVVSEEADLRVSVKTPTTWGYAAAGIIAALVVILGAIMKKYGRR